jgi:hypothetical protein
MSQFSGHAIGNQRIVSNSKEYTAAEIIAAGSPHLQALAQHARRLQRLSVRLREVLDAPLAEHVQVANLSDRCLVLQTDSPAWATRLRYRSADVLRHLGADLGEHPPASVRVIVRPPETLGPPRTGKHSTLHRAPETAASDRDADGLAGALRRLSRHFTHR